MRGKNRKNILWLSLIAMLLIVSMSNVGFSVPPTPLPEISIDPNGRIPGPGQLGSIGEIYPMTISISNVENLWACQFTIAYAPFYAVLTPQDFTAGPFLAIGVEDEDWSMNVVSIGLYGEITFIIMKLYPPAGDPVGETGSGVLATFNFLVKEAGESAFEITDSILLDPDVNQIAHTRGPGGYYYGDIARLVRVNLPDYGRKIKVGQTFTIATKVQNKGNHPLYVTVRFDIRRVSDGRPIELLPGQTYYGGYLGAPPPRTYLYCDGYYPAIEGGWNNPGASLIGVPDGNVANSTIASSLTSFYTFEDITLPWEGYSVMSNVDIEGYTKQDGLGNDFDPYAWTYDDEGNLIVDWAWCDSMGGSPVWAWTGQRYYYGRYDFPEYYGFPRTETAVNNAELLLHNFGDDDVLMEIDALRMRIEFATITPVDYPIFVVQPDEYLELDPIWWVSAEDHIGTYELTAMIEYSGVEDPNFRHYNSMASTLKTLHFWIVP